MKQFEYKVTVSRIATTKVDRDNAEFFLDNLGKEGWELCAADNGQFVFKREVAETVVVVHD